MASLGDKLTIAFDAALTTRFSRYATGLGFSGMIISPSYYIDTLIKDFKKATAKLPPCPEKELCDQYAKSVQVGYVLGRIAWDYEDYKKGKKKKFDDSNIDDNLSELLKRGTISDVEAGQIRETIRIKGLVRKDIQLKITNQWCGIPYGKEDPDKCSPCINEPRRDTIKYKIMERIREMERS